PVLDLELGVEAKLGYRLLAVTGDGKLALTDGLSEISAGQDTGFWWPIREIATGRVTGGLGPHASLRTAAGRKDFTAFRSQAFACQAFAFSADGSRVVCTGSRGRDKTGSLTLFEMPAGRGRDITFGMRDPDAPIAEDVMALSADLRVAA